MMRSLTIISSTAAAIVMMAGSTSASSSSSSTHSSITHPQHHYQEQEEEYWYPDFGDDYESGRCTTTPTDAIKDFVIGMDVTTLAQPDKEWCCEIWFPAQERCGCLGGCRPEVNENDAAHSLSMTATPLDNDEDAFYWYPQFDVSYEGGRCVQMGDDATNDSEPAPSYYTKDNGFLFASRDECCDWWFGHQLDDSCMTANANDDTSEKTQQLRTMNTNETSAQMAADAPVVEYDSSQPSVVQVNEETQ